MQDCPTAVMLHSLGYMMPIVVYVFISDIGFLTLKHSIYLTIKKSIYFPGVVQYVKSSYNTIHISELLKSSITVLLRDFFVG